MTVVDEFEKSFDGASVKTDLIRDPSEFCAYNDHQKLKNTSFMFKVPVFKCKKIGQSCEILWFIKLKLVQ